MELRDRYKEVFFLLVISIGWFLFSLGSFLNFFDEIISKLDLVDIYIEGIVTLSGLIVVAYGSYNTYLRVRESEKKFRRAFNTSPNPKFLVSEESVVVDVNETALDKLGYKKEELVGSPIEELPFLPKESVEKFLDRFKKRLRGKEITSYKIEIKTKGNRTLIAEVNAEKLEIEGIFKGGAVVIRDITERKRAEEREEFLHSLLRHDLKNKTHATEGYLELLEDTGLSKGQKRYVKKGLKTIRQANGLIKRVRKLRKLKEEEITEVSVDKVIGRIIKGFKGKKVDILYNEKGCKAKVKAGLLLGEVFSNILENAVKHSEGSKVYISGRTKGDKLICTIEDNGKGIPNEDKNKVFKKGYRKGKTKGEGLGLYISKRIMKSYGGNIKVKDSDKGGTRFDIYIPKV